MNLLGSGLSDHQSQNKEGIHWPASRLLIKILFPSSSIQLIKDEYNKPHVLIDGKQMFISITHSHQYASVMVSGEHQVALDMELIDHRIERVAQKFMTEQEFSFMDAQHKRQMQTVIWSAKESLYKYYGKKELDFKKHLAIAPFAWHNQIVELTGYIQKNNLNMALTVHVEVIEDYVLTYIG